MHDEEDPRWGEASAAAIRNIWRIAAEIAANTPKPITRETKIFRNPTGDEELELDFDRPDETPSGLYHGTEGWIESSAGQRERVVYRFSEWKRERRPDPI